MSVSYQKLISDLQGKSINVPKYFYNLLYNKNITYHVGGYSIISIYPPDLSGIGLSPETILSKGIVDTILFGLDFNGVDVSVETSQANDYIPYGTKVTRSGTVSCSFLDSGDLHNYSFHKVWIDYIDAVRLGSVEPSGKYISGGGDMECAVLDYVGSIYAVSFKPDLTTPVYTSKSIGCFPVSLSDKEIIGSRASPDIAIYSVTYQCAHYDSEAGEGELYGKFLSDVGSRYN